MGVSPIQKVIELLQENKMKVAKDLQSEGKEMAEYATFCDDETSEKTYAIKTATRSITDLTADLQDGDAQVKASGAEITDIGNVMAAKERDLADAKEIRHKDKTDFQATEKELGGAVDSLDRAIIMIKRSTSLVQSQGVSKPRYEEVRSAMTAIASILDAGWVNSDFKAKLQGLVQTGITEDTADLSLSKEQLDAKAKVFQKQSGGLVGNLEDMLGKAQSTLSNARSAEMKANHQYQMMAQSLTDALEAAKDRFKNAKQSSAAAKEANGKAMGELKQTESTKAADQKYLFKLKQDCQEAAINWEERQANGKEEMAVIDKASQLLADKAQPKNSLVQQNDPDSETGGAEDSMARERVVMKLKDMSKKYGSFALMNIVSSATRDPMEKIAGLINQMIGKLQAEAAEDATQKAFCDEEKAKSGAQQDKKSMRVDKLTARINTATTTKAELEEKIKELDEEISALDKGMAEATKIRAEERATYEVASKDFKEAAEAVVSAISMLKDYYRGASLLQQGKGDATRQPKLGSAQSDSAGTIISIMEMCGEDFQKLYMETEQNEIMAVDEFKALQEQSKASRSSKKAEAKSMASEIKSLEVAVRENGEDLSMSTKELDAVNEYIEKLRPQCEVKVLSYAEKKARKEAEIEGLKEALQILDTEGGALVQVHKRFRGA